MINIATEFIYGETVKEYRVNYLESGICIAPKKCRFDYVIARYMGCTLRRTKTIANGDGLCDFGLSGRGLLGVFREGPWYNACEDKQGACPCIPGTRKTYWGPTPPSH